MTPLTPAELHAKQLADTIAAGLPTIVAFSVTEARLQAELLALLMAWRHPAIAPVVEVEA